MKYYRLNARAVIALREAEGLTQTALAKRLGISKASMCQFENGQRQPSAATAKAIAKALGAAFGEITEPAEQPAEAS
jgi:transcriptional regulator with XRE-family HTH domain